MNNKRSTMDTKNNPDHQDSLGYVTQKPGTLKCDIDIIQCATGSDSNLWGGRCNNWTIKHSNRNTKNKSSKSHKSSNKTTITRRRKGKLKVLWKSGILNFDVDTIQYANGSSSNLRGGRCNNWNLEHSNRNTKNESYCSFGVKKMFFCSFSCLLLKLNRLEDMDKI